MKLMGAVLCVAAICGVGLAAQTTETTTTRKVTVKDGKDVSVTGCVAPAVTGTGFVLTNVADKTGDHQNYMLVTGDAAELSKHVGHRMQINGEATDRGDAKVKIETTSRTKVEHGDEREVHGKAEIDGSVGMPYLAVKSLKMIASVCP